MVMSWLDNIRNAALDAVLLYLPDEENIILEKYKPGALNIHDEDETPSFDFYPIKAVVIPSDHKGTDTAVGLKENITLEAVWLTKNNPRPALGDIVSYEGRRFKVQTETPYTLNQKTEFYTARLISITDN